MRTSARNISVIVLLLLASARSNGQQSKLSYHISGEADTTLLFIHGWNIDQSYWSGITPKLLPRYKIVTLDLPGHGNSKVNPGSVTLDGMIQDITKMIFKEDLNRIIVIGHSMGGELSLMLWLQVPDKIVGIVGVDNFKDLEFRITEPIRKQINDYIATFEKDYPKMAEQVARENLRTTDSTVVNRIVHDYRAADPRIAIPIFRAIIFQSEYNRTILKALPFPLHVVAADYQPYNEEALQAYAKSGYSIEWVTNSGHFPMVEQPLEFFQALERTLAHISQPR